MVDSLWFSNRGNDSVRVCSRLCVRVRVCAFVCARSCVRVRMCACARVLRQSMS